MKSYKEIKKALIDEGSYAVPRLQKLTFDLIKLVEKDEIEAFSFRKNETRIDGSNYIEVNVYFKKDDSHVVLGMFEHLDEFPRIDKMKDYVSSETFTKLEGINEYLSFANEHLKRDIPLVKEQTYYSINAANHLGGFKDKPIKNLLPDFMSAELAPMKTNKLK